MLCERTVRVGAEKPNDRHRLRARRQRPCCSRAADKRDELAAVHSITSSAVESSVAGTVRPSALAVLRLITNSNLVGCTTGKSPGLALCVRKVRSIAHQTTGCGVLPQIVDRGNRIARLQ